MTTKPTLDEDFKDAVTSEPELPDDEIENGSVLKLSRVYDFEERKIDRLDFKWFDDIELSDMNRAADILTNSGRVVLNPEMDAQYCLYIAAVATHTPHEFFEDLKPRDIMRIRNKVRNLFYGKG